MAEYIEREKALNDFDEWIDTTGALPKGTSYYHECRACIEDVPAADVVEVKHGYWVKNAPNPEAMKSFHEMGIGKAFTENSIYWTCSCCGKWGTPIHKYCSECGAKMDGDKNGSN